MRLWCTQNRLLMSKASACQIFLLHPLGYSANHCLSVVLGPLLLFYVRRPDLLLY